MILALFSLFAIPAFSAILPPAFRGLKAGKKGSYAADLGCMRYMHSGSTSNFYVRTDCNDEGDNVEYGPTKIVKAECKVSNHQVTGDWYSGMFAEMDYGVWYVEGKKMTWSACYCNWWMKWEKSDEILVTWAYKEKGEGVKGDWDINEEICKSECKAPTQGFTEMGETVLQGGDYFDVSMKPWASEGWTKSYYNLDVCLGDNPYSSGCLNSCVDTHTENNVTPSLEFSPALEGHWVGEEWYQNVQISDEMKNMEECADNRWITRYGSTYTVSGCKEEPEKASIMTSAILDNSCKKVLGTVYGRTVEIDQGWDDWLGCYCMYWRVHPADNENRRTMDFVWATDTSVNSYDEMDKCGATCPEPENPSVYMMIGPDHLHYGGQQKYVCEAGECLDETTHECGAATTCGDKGVVKNSDSKDKAGKTSTACECQAKCMKDSNDYFSYKLPKNEGQKGQCFCHKGGSVKKNEKSKMMVGGL